MDVFSASLWEVNNTDTHAKASQWAKGGNPTALNTTEVTKNEIILNNKILQCKISVSESYTMKFTTVEAIQYKPKINSSLFNILYKSSILGSLLYTQCIART